MIYIYIYKKAIFFLLCSMRILSIPIKYIVRYEISMVNLEAKNNGSC